VKPPAAVDLWLVDRDQTAELLAQIEAATPRLSAADLARAAAIADPALRGRWLAGRTALRLLLEVHCGPGIRQQPLALQPDGRPFLSQSGGVDFSLADSGSFLLIAIATGQKIGVDVEMPRNLRMSTGNIAAIMSAGGALCGDALHNPLQAWTRIEAFAKAANLTLAATLAAFGIQGHGLGPLTAAAIRQRSFDACAAQALHVCDLRLGHHLVGAIAAEQAARAPDVKPLGPVAIRRMAEG
jgi:phosphopantetheinyl transferase